MKNTWLKVFLTLVSIVLASVVSAEKSNRLVLLAMIPRTGDEPRDGRCCMASMQVAVEAVNNRTDILPDYRIELQFEDEGGQAALAPVKFVNFIDRFQKAGTNKTYLAPTFVGTMFLCQTSSGIVRYFSMVQFTQGCVGTLYTANRKRFPNIYRVNIAAEMITIPMMFVVQKLGQWRQVAILSNSGNVNNDLAAKVFYQVAVNSKIEVVWFSGVYDIDSSVVGSLKDSDARVVAVFMIEGPMAIKFYCQTYMMGVTAPKYIFLFQNRAFIDPETPGLQLIPGCNRSMIAEQLKIAFFSGLGNQAVRNYGFTPFGYDLDDYEKRFNKIMNNSRPPDYQIRHQCHDAMEGAILAMHSAEQNLKSQHNLTLKDFATHPEIIMRAVNVSAAKSNFMGLRIGKMAYSERLEVDSEVMFVTQWVNKSMRTIGRVGFGGYSEADIYNFSYYNATVLQEVIWATKIGKPPKDLSTIDRLFTTVPSFLYPSSIVLCVLVSFVQVVSLKFSLGNAKDRPVFSRFTDLSLVVGCVAINGSAVLFSMDISNSQICILRLIFSVLGISLLNANSFPQQIIIAFEAKAHLLRYYLTRLKNRRPNKQSTMLTLGKKFSAMTKRGPSLTVTSTAGNTISYPSVSAEAASSRATTTNSIKTNGSTGYQATHTSTTQSRITSKSIQDRNAALNIGIACFTLIGMAILAIGLSVDPPKVISNLSPAVFDDDDDTYYDTQTDICISTGQSFYLGALLAINGLGLIFGGTLAFQSRHMVYSGPLHSHVISVRIAVANSATLFLVGAFMVIIIPPVQIGLQAIVLTFLAIVYSATNSAILIYPKVKVAFKTDDHPENDIHLQPVSVTAGAQAARQPRRKLDIAVSDSSNQPKIYIP